MKTVIIASKSPVKVEATRAGFLKVFGDEEFRVEPVSVPSGVADQPTSDAETYQGAENRAQTAQEIWPQADFWVGIEGGIEDFTPPNAASRGENTHPETLMWAFAWVVVRSREQHGSSRTAAFALPPKVAMLVRQGYELGKADDLVFDRANSKRKEGAVGILTNNIIDRQNLYEPAVILALIPFDNSELYSR